MNTSSSFFSNIVTNAVTDVAKNVLHKATDDFVNKAMQKTSQSQENLVGMNTMPIADSFVPHNHTGISANVSAESSPVLSMQNAMETAKEELTDSRENGGIEVDCQTQPLPVSETTETSCIQNGIDIDSTKSFEDSDTEETKEDPALTAVQPSENICPEALGSSSALDKGSDNPENTPTVNIPVESDARHSDNGDSQSLEKSDEITATVGNCQRSDAETKDSLETVEIKEHVSLEEMAYQHPDPSLESLKQSCMQNASDEDCLPLSTVQPLTSKPPFQQPLEHKSLGSASSTLVDRATLYPPHHIPRGSNNTLQDMIQFLSTGYMDKKYYSVNADERGGFFLETDKFFDTLDAQYPQLSALCNRVMVKGKNVQFIHTDAPLEVYIKKMGEKLEGIQEAPKIKNTAVELYDFYAGEEFSRDLLEDGKDFLIHWFKNKAAVDMAHAINKFILGSHLDAAGANLLNSTNTSKVAIKDDQFADNALEQLYSAIYQLPAQDLHKAQWVMNGQSLGKLKSLLVKRISERSFDTDAQTLLGFPVHICNEVPKLSRPQEEEKKAFMLFGNFNKVNVYLKKDTQILREASGLRRDHVFMHTTLGSQLIDPQSMMTFLAEAVE